MRTRKLFWLIFALIICIGTIAYAPAAQATDHQDASLSKWGSQYEGILQVKVQRSHMGKMPVNLVVYDQDWKVVDGVELMGNVYTFDGLRMGDYQVLAETDSSEISLVEDIPIVARQVTLVELELEQEKTSTHAAGGSGNVAGESTMPKINPSYGVTIIYLQCGHVVGKVGPADCGCSSGGWRYTSECPKSETIYLTLPCYRRKP